MKILLFYTYNQSFLAAFFNELALSLQERGWDVIVFSFKKESGIIEKPFRVKIKRKQNYLKNGVEIYKAIQKYKPDVVVSNFSYVNATVFSSRILGVKKNVVWFHTLSDQLNSNKFQIFRKSVFLKLASKIIVNSNELKIDLIDDYNVKPDKIVPIPFWSGLENDFVQKRQEKQEILKIGIPGRIEKVKNQKIILDLLLKYEELQNIKWVFAGSGSEEERLKDQVRKNKLENSIKFLGVLGIGEMKAFYKEIDIIVLPSKFESFGLVLIEALSMNCPVIVSEKFGALNYIDDNRFLTRYTFDPLSIKDLKTKLDQIEISLEPNEYFSDIYLRYFNKEEFINSVEKIIQ